MRHHKTPVTFWTPARPLTVNCELLCANSGDLMLLLLLFTVLSVLCYITMIEQLCGTDCGLTAVAETRVIFTFSSADTGSRLHLQGMLNLFQMNASVYRTELLHWTIYNICQR